MIKIENIETWGFEHAVRGMRNPLDSWDKSDSYTTHIENTETLNTADFQFVLGDNDLALMRKLYKSGPEHRKYLRQIFVSMDITAPLYWIAQLDTYKIGTAKNSCSFMHKGTAEQYTINDFSVHDDRVYKVLSPCKRKQYDLRYPYETDEFKNYVGENGREYKIFRNGKVVAKPFEYTDTKGRHRIFEEKECKPSKTSSGYYEINIGGRTGAKWQLHRLIASVWIENPNNFNTVNHIDGDKGNNSIENLEWCDLSDNIKKGFEAGLFENGKSLHARYQKWKNGHIVIDPYVKSQVVADHVKNGLTCRQLAEKYDITIKQANNMISQRQTENQDLFELCHIWETIIDALNKLRAEYLETKDEAVFQQIRCLMPNGYNQRFTLTMNYENVVTIIKQRSGHKLDEWREMVDVLKELPYIRAIAEDEE